MPFFSCAVAGGLELFSDLLQRFPNNLHLLLETAKVETHVFKEVQFVF